MNYLHGSTALKRKIRSFGSLKTNFRYSVAENTDGQLKNRLYCEKTLHLSSTHALSNFANLFVPSFYQSNRKFMQHYDSRPNESKIELEKLRASLKLFFANTHFFMNVLYFFAIFRFLCANFSFPTISSPHAAFYREILLYHNYNMQPGLSLRLFLIFASLLFSSEFFIH